MACGRCAPQSRGDRTPRRGNRLTYAALDERISRCTTVLRELPSQPGGERVATLGRNRLDQVVLAMACQRTGAIFVPLNWRLTAVGLRALCEDCGPALLIHDAEFVDAARLAGGNAARLPFEGEGSLSAHIDAAIPSPATPEANAPFALLYTSGTTGRPKGVIITRENAFFAALNFALVGEVDARSVVLADLPLFHTIGLIAVTRTTLLMGGTLVISDRFAPARTLAALADPANGVTHYFGVPQIASALREAPGFDGAKLTALHAIFVGGAPLSRSLVDAYQADGVPLVNGFGMSEAGTVIHMPIDAAAIRENPGAIGRPAPFMGTRVVGQDGRDASDGQIGELWIRGPAVTPGYWRRPDETAAAFTAGWYRTGDLVRRDAAGIFTLVDRLKDMFISGGENVYPAEVEGVLLSHPAVADVAVIGVPDPRWGECGLAAIVVRPGAVPDDADIHRHCAERLARYKCPARVVFTDAIPRTASGKVQKHLLRQTLAPHDQEETP